MRAHPALHGLSLILAAALLSACSSEQSGSESAGPPPSAPAPSAKPRAPLSAPEHSGGALMRSADGTRLYLADEDHKALRVLPLPFGEEPKPAPSASASASASAAPDASASAAPGASGSAAPSGSAAASAAASGSGAASARPSASASASARTRSIFEPPPPPPPWPPPPNAKQEETAMPGAPAQVLPVDGFVLATIRDPGLLLVLKEEPDNKLKEEGRIQLAADAWGVALTKDEKVAVVTSAWTHTVTGIDWRARKVLWTLNVAREPRGVVIHPNGKTAYVSHLTSADLTRIDDVASEGAKASRVAFPAAPMRTPVASPLDASLGYSLVIDDAGNRLLAARHALGALAADTWFGVSTIDVLQTQNDKPLLSPRVPDKRIRSTPAFDQSRQWAIEHSADEPDGYRQRQWRPQLQGNNLVQPRAMIVAHKSQTVWVAYEGHDVVAEYPLLAAAPGEVTLRLAFTGRNYRDPKVVDPNGDYNGIPSDGASPTGLALSSDETLLYVFCRTTYDVVTVRVGRTSAEKGYERLKAVGETKTARVAAEPLDDTVSRGRKLFYGGRDTYSSGGMGCAGCHPEGRDDGHVWHEVFPDPGKDDANFLATKNLAFKTKEGKLGYPRQTPMLAGRMSSSGPFGWHAQNATLSARLAEGFQRHRWGSGWDIDPKSWMTNERAVPLAAFLRRGLVPPPRAVKELTDEQKKGKEVFDSAATKCVQCHTPATEFTTRLPYPLKKVDPPAGFEDEENNNFKAPSLLFVGGTGPYYHDGSMPTLQDLIAKNGDRMGTTSHLSASERAALVAYLETL